VCSTTQLRLQIARFICNSPFTEYNRAAAAEKASYLRLSTEKGRNCHHQVVGSHLIAVDDAIVTDASISDYSSAVADKGASEKPDLVDCQYGQPDVEAVAVVVVAGVEVGVDVDVDDAADVGVDAEVDAAGDVVAGDVVAVVVVAAVGEFAVAVPDNRTAGGLWGEVQVEDDAEVDPPESSLMI